LISIVTPAFNERSNLPVLHRRLSESLKRLDWEWVIVDDHSKDDTFAVIEHMALGDPRVRGFRLARNSGSHIAITCGLGQARGNAAALVVSDLQDPPELLVSMVERWSRGAQVVWAVKRQQPGSGHQAWFPAIYYWIMRRLVGLTEMPATGVDFFVIDRVVIDAFLASAGRHVSVFALLMWLGFRSEFIEYDKQPRASGQSGWTLARRVKLLVDSVVGLSDVPIWWCVCAGCGLLVTAIVTAAAMSSATGAGVWLVFGLFGLQLVAAGIVGLYVWRALDDARGTPIYTIEAVAGSIAAPVPAPPSR
jgi:dolichol-phosphate mannosyltransferase